MIAPFEYHPARPAEIEDRALQLLRLAEEAADRRAVTDRAFQPAEVSWRGVAAAELRAAPQDVRDTAERVASQLSWAAVPLRYWAEQVRRFNLKVDTLLLRLAGVPAEVERRVRGRVDGPAEQVGGFAGSHGRDVLRSEIRHQLIDELRREWEEAYETFIRDGARTAAGMLAQGPTYEYLRVARGMGLMPAGGLVSFFAVDWDRKAAVDEVLRIAAAMGDLSAPPAVEEIEQLASLLCAYEGDQEFAFLLMAGLGPRGVLELTALAAGLTFDPTWQKGSELAGVIQSGLAAALALATRTRDTGGSPYTRSQLRVPLSWIKELIDAGAQEFALTRTGPPVRGFHLLGVLVTGADFDSGFLAEVGGALIDYEIAHGGSDAFLVPHSHYDFRLNWIHPESEEVGTGLDPMTGLMFALSSDLEAAKRLFTAGAESGSNEGYLWLDYLLTDREWPVDVAPRTATTLDGHVNPGIAVFGQMLERVTAVEVDERSYQIVESIIRAIAEDESIRGLPNNPTGALNDPSLLQQAEQSFTGIAKPFLEVDVIHDNLRPYLGRIASRYIDELHWAMRNGTIPAELRDAGVKLDDIDVRSLTFFLAEVGKNLDARNEIVAAEFVYADRLYRYYLDGWDMSDEATVSAVNRRVTEPLCVLLGAVDLGATEAIRRGYAEADEAHNSVVAARMFWLRFGASLLGGNRKTEAVGFLVGTVLDELEQEMRRDSTGIVDYYVGDFRYKGATAVTEMIDVVIYEELTRRLTPDEFLSRVPNKDQSVVKKLLYSEGHPLEGNFVPPVDWGEDEWKAWKAYKSFLDETNIGSLQADAFNKYLDGDDDARDILEGEKVT